VYQCAAYAHLVWGGASERCGSGGDDSGGSNALVMLLRQQVVLGVCGGVFGQAALVYHYRASDFHDGFFLRVCARAVVCGFWALFHSAQHAIAALDGRVPWSLNDTDLFWAATVRGLRAEQVAALVDVEIASVPEDSRTLCIGAINTETRVNLVGHPHRLHAFLQRIQSLPGVAGRPLATTLPTHCGEQFASIADKVIESCGSDLWQPDDIPTVLALGTGDRIAGLAELAADARGGLTETLTRLVIVETCHWVDVLKTVERLAPEGADIRITDLGPSYEIGALSLLNSPIFGYRKLELLCPFAPERRLRKTGLILS